MKLWHTNIYNKLELVGQNFLHYSVKGKLQRCNFLPFPDFLFIIFH